MQDLNCLIITKCDTADFTSYSGFVNKQYERFKISTITDEEFKYLIFACGLRSAVTGMCAQEFCQRYYSAASYRGMSAAGESKAWFRYGTTVGTCSNIHNQHYPKTTVTGSNTRETSTCLLEFWWQVFCSEMLLQNSPLLRMQPVRSQRWILHSTEVKNNAQATTKQKQT